MGSSLGLSLFCSGRRPGSTWRASHNSVIPAVADNIGAKLEEVLSGSYVGPDWSQRCRRQSFLWHVNVWARLGSNAECEPRSSGIAGAAFGLPLGNEIAG